VVGPYSLSFESDCRLKVRKSTSPDILLTIGDKEIYGTDCKAKFQGDCHLLIDTGLSGGDRFSFRSDTSYPENDGCFVAVYRGISSMRIGVFLGSSDDPSLTPDWSEALDEDITLPTSSPTKKPPLSGTTSVPSFSPTTGLPTSSPSVSPLSVPSTQGPTKEPSRSPSRLPSYTPTVVPSVSPTTPFPTGTPAEYYVFFDDDTEFDKGETQVVGPYSLSFESDCRLKVRKSTSPDILLTIGDKEIYGTDCKAKFQGDCHLLIDTGLSGGDRFSFRSDTSYPENDGCFVAVYRGISSMRIGVFLGSSDDPSLTPDWSEAMDEYFS